MILAVTTQVRGAGVLAMIALEATHPEDRDVAVNIIPSIDRPNRRSTRSSDRDDFDRSGSHRSVAQQVTELMMTV